MWQPIETAPKDGTRVMLYRPGQDPVFGRWNSDRFASKPKPFWDHDLIRLHGMLDARKNPPTHWQPLPDPPAD
jgi:hypothetical protein